MGSTKGCRLRATDRPIIRVKGSTGITGGYVDLGTVNGRSRKQGKRPSKRTTKGAARKCRNR